MSEPGLRERKKRETARAIEVAAVELAFETSLAEATVEAISLRADVTSRTFFNYYGSKEDAVLGNSRAFPPPAFGELAVEPGRPLVDTLVSAISAELSQLDLGSPDFLVKKRAIVNDNPHLLLTDFQTLGSIESTLAARIGELLAEQGEVPAAQRQNHAWALVFEAGSVLRLAMHTWSHDSGTGRPIAEHIASAQRLMASLRPSRVPALS